MRRSNVDLPQPEGPTNTANSPSLMSRLTSLMTLTAPNALRTACNWIAPIVAYPLAGPLRPALASRAVPDCETPHGADAGQFSSATTESDNRGIARRRQRPLKRNATGGRRGEATTKSSLSRADRVDRLLRQLHMRTPRPQAGDAREGSAILRRRRRHVAAPPRVQNERVRTRLRQSWLETRFPSQAPESPDIASSYPESSKRGRH